MQLKNIFVFLYEAKEFLEDKMNNFSFLEIPAIFSSDMLGNQEEIGVMSKCNDALDRLIIPSLENDMRGDDSGIIYLDDFFDEIESYGVDPCNYIHFVAEEVEALCRGT